MKGFIKENSFVIFCILLFNIVCIPFFTWSLWRDETFSINLAMSDVARIINIVANDTQPPLHILILHYWGKLFSYSEFSMRVISFISMLLSILIIRYYSKFFITERLSRNILLILLVVNPMVMFYATEARPYALFFLFFNLAFLQFYKLYYLKQNSFVNTIIFTLFTILMLYTHTIAIIPTLVFGVITLAKSLKEEKIIEAKTLKLSKANTIILFKKLLAFVVILLAYLPWAYIVLKQLTQFEDEGFWYTFKPLYSVFEGLTRLFIGSDLNSDMKLEHVYLMTFISSLCLGLLIWSCFKYLYRSGFKADITNVKFTTAQFIYVFIVLNLIIIWGLSFKTPLFLARYLFYLLPLVLIILTLGIKSFGRRLSIVITLIVVISTLSFQFISLFLQPYKADFKAAARYVDREFNAETDIILSASVLNFHSPYYYLENDIYLYDPNYETNFFEGRAILAEEDYFKGTLVDYERIWVFNRLDMDRQLYMDLQSLGFGLDWNVDFRKISVQRWSR